MLGASPPNYHKTGVIMINEQIGINVEGHIKIVDFTDVDIEKLDLSNIDFSSLKILEDKRNAIHFENMSYALASSFIGNNTYLLDSLTFGNGGTYSEGTTIQYNSPNTVGTSSNLYNEIFNVKINSSSGSTVNNTTNMFTNVRHLPGNLFTDIVVTCILDGSFSYSTSTNGTVTDFTYDEFGLFDKNGRMLTHVIFNPRRKTINSKVGIFYTLRISSIAGAQ